MSQRLKRIRKRVNNNELQKQRAALPPLSEVRRQARILRETFPDDPHVQHLVKCFEETDKLIFSDGCTVRKGGGEATESRRWPLLPEWGGKEPPERP
jgi:hypothetical protein